MKKLFIIGLLIISAVTLSANTINIPADYSTIQEGINASVDGDTVLISQGTYYENLTIFEKEIVLASHAINDELGSGWFNNENILETIISGAHNPANPNKGSCLIIRNGNVQPTIIGLTFQDGTGTSMKLDNCGKIQRERSGGAILIYKAYPTLKYNRFIDNGHDADDVRASGGGRKGGAISHYSDDGVEFDEDRSLTNPSNNSTRDIPEILNIQNNYFENNSSGDGENFYSYGYDGSIDMSFSMFENIDCDLGEVNEFVLRSVENEADFVQNEISGNCIDGNTFYVSAGSGDDHSVGTQSDPFETIGHALTLVKRGNETVTTINVGSGVYSPSTNGEKFPIVVPDNVHLIGANMQWTKLDAQADEDAEAAVMIILEVENVRVANMTLTGGYSEGHGCTGGGGLLLAANDMFNLGDENGDWATSTPVIENVIIKDNHSHNGGGLATFRVNGPVLNNVEISGNVATAFGGGVFAYVSTITMNGVTISDNHNLGNGQGGGIMLAATAGTFDNMTITNNTANGSHGGGIWTNNSGGPGNWNTDGWIMKNSIISGNTSSWNGGGLCLLESAPTLINVTFSGNTAGWGGGAVGAMWSSPKLINCNITGNEANGPSWGGGGVWAGWVSNISANPVIENCIISENTTAGYGGGICLYQAQGATLNRVSVVDNYSSAYIGGIYIATTPATLTNCTISGNTSAAGGGIGIQSNGHANITNSIVWDNYGIEVWVVGGSASVTYSDIQGGYTGQGNINENPLFMNPENGDYSLSLLPYWSPCIDAGTAVDDIEYVGDAPDMGAFEHGGILGCTDPDASNYDPQANMNDGSCEYSSSGPSNISVSYNTGWNMVGLALEVEDSYYQTLFPSALNNAMYSFDGSYSPAANLVAGTGYLIRLLDGGTLEFSGESIDELTLSLTEGWNLVSGISSSLSVDVLYGSGLVVSNGIYGFDGSYHNAYTIDPGMGYWVRASADGDITLGSGASAKQVSIINRLEGANSISFSTEDYSTNLFFGINIPDGERLNYSLPPTFPQMPFDVRFSSDTKVLLGSGEIELMNQLEMVTIEYDIKIYAGDDMVWVLTSKDNDEYILEGTGSFVVSSGDGFTLERKSVVVPALYALYQNYPNPFNPITTLMYDLPSDALVTLSIYDMLGREVTQLVNTTQDAGFKSVQWDATDAMGNPVSAGVYLYQIQAGEFMQTKKMILLK